MHEEPDRRWPCQSRVLEALALIAARGMPFDVYPALKGHLETVLELAAAMPGLTIVVDHLGHPQVAAGRWEPWATLMAGLAAHERVVVKLSGLEPPGPVGTTGRVGVVDAYRPYVEHVLEHFGAARVMWASNWPATGGGAVYTEVLDESVALLAGLDDRDRAEVLAGTARRTYAGGNP
jgi:L-fuconolactonase